MNPDEIKAKLNQAFPEAEVDVIDLTGTRDHFQVQIVSKQFEGLGLVEQHRLVYSALGESVGGPIHALALKTMTPAQWEKTKGSPK